LSDLFKIIIKFFLRNDDIFDRFVKK